MEKKTRKKSTLVTILTVLISLTIVIVAIIFGSTYLSNSRKTESQKNNLEGITSKENIEKSNNEMLYKIAISNDIKYINKYGYIVNSDNNSVVELTGINIKPNEEKIENDLLVDILKLY